MPRIDRTFTNRDVIRIFCENLDKEERSKVLIFFLIVIPVFFSFDFILDALILLIPGRTGKILQKFFGIIGGVLSELKAPVIALIVDEVDRKTVIECLEDLDI